MQNWNIKKEVLAAERNLETHIRQTPLEYSPYLSQLIDGSVFLKLENMQMTGSFKIRGALNKYLSLDEEDKQKILVTASSGNHGIAFAWIINKFGARGEIYLPRNTDPVKISALKTHGVKMVLEGDDCVVTEKRARKAAREEDRLFFPPYNDLKVIGGQGTIGSELIKQRRDINAVLVPVGGGGLISGISGFIKPLKKEIRVVGCQPENSAVMYRSILAGRIVEEEMKPTLAGGSAGGIEPDSVTFDICQKYVDDFILVTEEQIRKAILLALDRHHILVEGAGALGIASLLKDRDQFSGKTVVCIITGARISTDTLRKIL